MIIRREWLRMTGHDAAKRGRGPLCPSGPKGVKCEV